jgi:hypothetical protein
MAKTSADGVMMRPRSASYIRQPFRMLFSQRGAIRQLVSLIN